jgi:hypothetical protein
MYKEKHILNHHTAGHKLSRYLDVYELDTVNCSADKTTGYKGDTITITGTPAWNEKTSSYSVTGATLTGNKFDFTGSDVTAQANYETAKTITTQNCSANKVSGFSGDNVTVTGTPAWNQKLSGYGITGATLTGNNFKIANSNVTVQGKYETAKNVTLQTNGGGTIAASRVSGFIGDSVTLSNTPNASYAFSAYTLTGANLTGSTFNLTGSNVTAKAWFYQPVAKLADTSNYDIWVPKRATSLAPTVDRVGFSFDVSNYRYIVYCVYCVFYSDGFVLLRPNMPATYPAIYNHWNFAYQNGKFYIAQLSGTNGNYIANINTWTDGSTTATGNVTQADGMLAGQYVECSVNDHYPQCKLILDRQTSQVSAYAGYNGSYSGSYNYQGYATVKTTANSTTLETDCFANVNLQVNAHVKVYGCTAFNDAVNCTYE